MVIVSSDFTHHGPYYGYTPFVDNVKDGMYNFDKKAIELILKKETEKFYRFITEDDMTICGAYPIFLALHLVEKETGKLLKYYISGEITKDYTNSVGYGTISFK